MNESVGGIVRAAFGDGATVVRCLPLRGGMSAKVDRVTATLESSETRELTVRRRGEYWGRDDNRVRAEYALIEHVARSGIPVPKPLALVDDADGRPLAFVLEYVEGHAPMQAGEAESLAVAFAETLVRIHGVPLDGLAGLGRSPVGDVVALPPWWGASLSPEVVRVLQAWSGLTPCPIRERRLLHGDFWPGNIVVRDGAIAAVIDWEDAVIGDPVQDVAVVRLDLTWVAGPRVRDLFTAAYAQLSGRDLRSLPYWDLFAVLRAAPGIDLWAAVYPGMGRPDITAEAMREVLTATVDAALERIPRGSAPE